MADILHEHSTLIIALSYLALELVALAAAVHAVMNVRTAQGAIAWLLALVMLPIIALPLYAVFGRRRFMGYVAARRAGDSHQLRPPTQTRRAKASSLKTVIDTHTGKRLGMFVRNRQNARASTQDVPGLARMHHPFDGQISNERHRLQRCHSLWLTIKRDRKPGGSQDRSCLRRRRGKLDVKEPRPDLRKSQFGQMDIQRATLGFT